MKNLVYDIQSFNINIVECKDSTIFYIGYGTYKF